MTNQPPPTPSQENILSKIAGGFSWWINSLMGKPQARRIPQQVPTPPQPVMPPVAQGGSEPIKTPPPSGGTSDSVSQDIQALKSLVGKLSLKVGQNVTPQVEKGMDASTKVASDFVKKNPQVLKKVLIVVGVLLVLGVVGFMAMELFQGGGKENGGNGGVVETPTSTPTPIAFEPSKPSIYAQDPIILQLEEDIEVLVREITGTNIKETQINPPALDFNVTF